MSGSPVPISDADVLTLIKSVGADLGSAWIEYPGGWPGEIEAALIDAVLSIRARYGSPTTGVRASVRRWRDAREAKRLDNLAQIVARSPEGLAETLGNHQRLYGGKLKSAAIIEAAQNLTDVGVLHADNLVADSPTHSLAYTTVKGLGPVTWSYFTMLLGSPGIKADTWIVRYVARSLDRAVTSEEARQLLVGVAGRLQVNATALDYALWSHARKRP